MQFHCTLHASIVYVIELCIAPASRATWQEAYALLQAAVDKDQEGQAAACVRKQAGSRKKKRSPEEEAAKRETCQRHAACKSGQQNPASGSAPEGDTSSQLSADNLVLTHRMQANSTLHAARNAMRLLL